MGLALALGLLVRLSVTLGLPMEAASYSLGTFAADEGDKSSNLYTDQKQNGKYPSFKISRMKEVIKPTVPHKHDDYFEIILLSDGAGWHQVDTVSHEVKPPVAFVLRPGQVHCWNFSRIPKGYALLWKAEWLAARGAAARQLYNLPSMLMIPEGLGLAALAEQLAQDYNQLAPDAVLRAYLELILAKLFQVAEVGHVSASTIPKLLDYKRLLETDFVRHKQMSYYCQELGMTLARLNAVCKKATGRTASELLRERLILEAKNLLTHTGLSIAEIAYQLEFTDPSHFVKFFKQATTLTPRQYREMV
ncbi:MAG: helix-turn-helix domain-containing protein [Cytophagales bacterium]|nr:helix-turn-helix domain-containing protein [Cytophagales bacterium]